MSYRAPQLHPIVSIIDEARANQIASRYTTLRVRCKLISRTVADGVLLKRPHIDNTANKAAQLSKDSALTAHASLAPLALRSQPAFSFSFVKRPSPRYLSSGSSHAGGGLFARRFPATRTSMSNQPLRRSSRQRWRITSCSSITFASSMLS